MKIAGGWSQTPNEIIAAMPLMSGAEFKCTMVLIRETFGYHRRQVNLTYEDFRHQTGIKSTETLAGALKAIKARGYFLRIGRQGRWMIADKCLRAEQEDGSSKELDATIKGTNFEGNGNARTQSPQRRRKGHRDANYAKFGEEVQSTSKIEGVRLKSPSEIEEVKLRSPSKIEGVAYETPSEIEGVRTRSCSKIEGLQLYKERYLTGKERGGERKEAPARRIPGHDDFVEPGRNLALEVHEGDETVFGKGLAPHPEVPRPRTAVERDLATHPGTAVWLDCGLAWPGWYTLNVITKRLGEKPQIEVLKKAREMWAMAGYRQTNFEGILDWYDALCLDPSWRPFTRTKGQSGRAAESKNGPCSPTMAMLLEMEQELTHGKRSDHSAMFDSAAIGIPADGVWRGVGEDLPDDAG